MKIKVNKKMNDTAQCTPRRCENLSEAHKLRNAGVKKRLNRSQIFKQGFMLFKFDMNGGVRLK